MLIVVSPAKKLDFSSELTQLKTTEPLLSKKTTPLVRELKKLNKSDIKKLMKLSDNLSEVNYERFQNFSSKKSQQRAAAFAFNGDTYSGLDISSFTKTELNKAQQKLRILSGLYGILRPLDHIKPYRLEMGTNFKFRTYNNLYDYWKEDITNALNQDLNKNDTLINCASNEYFGAVDHKNLKAKIITPVFKELRDGKLKIISFSAKKARGMMAKFIIKNNIKDPEAIKKFNEDSYKFDAKLSTDDSYVFVR